TREVRWGPRTLDLDLIAAHDARTGAAVTHEDAVLTLPHPRAAERAFVLAPWADLDPDASLTTAAGPQPVRALPDRLGDAGAARPAHPVGRGGPRRLPGLPHPLGAGRAGAAGRAVARDRGHARAGRGAPGIGLARARVARWRPHLAARHDARGARRDARPGGG